jgi:hypothetical protein
MAWRLSTARGAFPMIAAPCAMTLNVAGMSDWKINDYSVLKYLPNIWAISCNPNESAGKRPLSATLPQSFPQLPWMENDPGDMGCLGQGT